MSKDTFTSPQVTDLSGKAPAAEATAPVVTKEVAPVAAAAPATAPATAEASFVPKQDVIAINKMVNAKGTVTTDIMVARIKQHMEFLSGAKRYKNKEEEVQEQVSFIETIGNSLKLDFPQFALVTDELLNAIRENKDVFQKGTQFRFTMGLDKTYPAQYIRTYQVYMTFLAMVAKNWVSRYKLDKLVDLAHVIHDFDRKGKENLTQYFRYLTQV